MNIFTSRIKEKSFHGAIEAKIQKHSQEYYVLATLRCLREEEFKDFYPGESPDLQSSSCNKGIEVTVVTDPNDMKAARELSNLKKATSQQEYSEIERKIVNAGYTVNKIPVSGSIFAESRLKTENGDKTYLRNAVINKLKKIHEYRKRYKNVGLALVFSDNPSSTLKDNCIDWIKELRGDDNTDTFDFFILLIGSLVIIYRTASGSTERYFLSKDARKCLQIIGRMTAEGELSLHDIEWQ